LWLVGGVEYPELYKKKFKKNQKKKTLKNRKNKTLKIKKITFKKGSKTKN